MLAKTESAAITRPYLIFWSLLIGAAFLLTWLSADPPLVETPAGYVAPFILLIICYLLMLGFMLLHRIGLKSHYFINGLLIAAIGLCWLHFVAYVFARLTEFNHVWDDAFMFMRYVHNMRVYGVPAWNIQDGASYGSTEILHLMLAWSISWLTGIDTPHQTIQLASLAGGIIFLVLCGGLVWRMTPTNLAGRLIVLLLLGLGLVIHTPFLFEHFISGMGATTDMAYLMAYLLLLHRYCQNPSGKILYITGICGGLAYYARPDLVLFSVICPFLIYVFAGSAANRARALKLCGITLAVIAGELLLAQLIFNSALPLPFYIKSASLSGKDFIYRTYGDVPGEQLEIFLNNNLYFLFLILPAMLVPVRTLQRWGITAFGASIAAFLYVMYYRHFVMQLMFYEQRFYYPVLPVFVFLTAGALGAVVEALWKATRDAIRPFAEAIASTLMALAIMGGVLFFPAWLVKDFQMLMVARNQMLQQPDRETYGTQLSNYMPELWSFSKVSPTLVVATTEVGLPSVLNPDWYIYDLSGLNNTGMAQHGFSVEDFFAHQPDLIYMPFPEYPELLGSISDYPTFKTDYELFKRSDLNGALDVAIRKSSPYFEQMRNILMLKIEKFQPPHE